MTTPVDQGNSFNNSRRNNLVAIVTCIFVLIALFALFFYWVVLHPYATTDDAYVGGDQIEVSSRIEGMVRGFNADDTNLVKQGQILIELDPTDALIALNKAKANLAESVREVVKLGANVKQKEAYLAGQKAVLTRSKQDFANRHGLIAQEAVAQEEFEHAQADLSVAENNVLIAEKDLLVAKVQFGNTPLKDHPQILVSVNAVKDAYITWKRCTIYAPATGYVTQRMVQVGQTVKPSEPLLSIVPLSRMWVDANFKETELEHVRIGQPCRVTIDMYGSDVDYEGEVLGIQPATGGALSLLPPQNASGNWIKIVQRVPVRVILNPEQMEKFPLRLGLSAYVSVQVTDRSGLVYAQKPSSNPVVTTDVYQIPMEEIEKEIAQIIQNNLP